MKFAALAGVATCVVALAGPWQGRSQGQEAPPQQIRDADVEAAFSDGQRLLNEKQYAQAVASLNRALALDPTYTDALILKGKSLQGMEDYQGASKAFTDALNYDANSAAAYNGRGECAMEVGQLDAALNDFFNAVELDRNNAQILSNIGHVLVNPQAGPNMDPVSALRYLDDALALNDQDARALRDRGLAHVRLGEFDESIADLSKASEVDPKDYENYSTLATVHLYQDDFEPAVDALGKAIEAYQPKKRTDLKIFVDGYLLRSDARIRLAADEADEDQRRQQLEAAIADADAVLEAYEERAPQNGIAYFRRGRAQRLLEQFSKAIDSFTRAIQAISPDQDPGYLADAYLYRGICFHYIGSEELARGDFQQASSTGNGFQDPRVYLWIGFTHHLQEDYREAIKWYSQAIAKSPSFTLAHTNRGRAYMDLKDYEKAVDSFNNAVRIEPDVGTHYYDVAFAYAKLEQFQKAVDFYDLALLKEHPQPRMYRGMAEALRQLGRNQLADEYDRQAEEAEAKMQAKN